MVSIRRLWRDLVSMWMRLWLVGKGVVEEVVVMNRDRVIGLVIEEDVF